MAEIDLSSMSLKELKALSKRVEKAIDSYEERQRAEALAKLEATAKEMGYSLSDLAGTPAKSGRKTVSAPKYRDPSDPSRTWTGRGRQPDWFKSALKAGKAPEDLQIA